SFLGARPYKSRAVGNFLVGCGRSPEAAARPSPTHVDLEVSMPAPIPLNGLNHVAWRCIDAEQTRHFYEVVLGLPLAHVIRSERVPSTGENAPFCHLFFEMQDGSYIAFFDIRDGRGATLSSDMPKWIHHFAFEVDTIDEVRAIKDRLEKHGIEVLGV